MPSLGPREAPRSSPALETADARETVLVLLGPTAVGKSRVAIEVARRLDGEVISADSRAFFRGLDIATDKVPPSDRRGVPHHLIDQVEPTGRYDAMAFRQDADRLIGEIAGRGRVPIVCGGGTLYIGAILRGLFAGPAADLALRRDLELLSPAELHARLKTVDPRAGARIHPHDRVRLVRALEVHALTGRPISAWQEEAKPLPYRFIPFGLTREKEDHKAAIAARVKAMIGHGLVAEVKGLREQGLDRTAQAFRTIGVREAFAFLDGEISEEELEESIVRNTWSLVRRQMAWFHGDKDVAWIDVTGRSPKDVVHEIATRFAQERGRDREETHVG
jgi:tRNA dimethylallyltransferase